ncbi:MAG: GAF domain-containing protein [Chryseolinea sp.]
MITIFKSKYLITVLLVFFITLLLINSIFTFYNDIAIVENNSLKIETETIKRRTSSIITDIIHDADLSVRGFALTKNEQLADPIKKVLKNKDSVFNNIEALLNKQRYDMTKFIEMRAVVENYLTFSMDMIQLARQDSMKQFIQLLNEDQGYEVWKKYEAFYVPLLAYEDGLNAAANEKYLSALSRNRLIQIMLMLLGMPTITYILWKLKSERNLREKFLTTLDQNNRKYIFDTGVSFDVSDWKEAVAHSIKNFQHANEFITRISAGDYVAEWTGLNQTNHSLNQINMAGNLVKMREHLKQTKIEEERRNWAVSGVAKFAEIIRNQTNFQTLGDTIISNVVKYTNSNQGSLFVVVNDENKEDVHLQLLSCYAWDKKKHTEKIVYEGQGLVGQCWQEGKSIFLTKVPVDYINITSGLGHANPRCIFIVPLKMNDKIYGVLELAAFQPYQEYEREFIEKVCETIASSIATVKVANQTKYLLEQSQQQTEAMRSHEEEMRQNMEELLATQEGIERLMKESRGNELYMRNLLDASTDSILTFDHEYKIIHCNEVARVGYLAVGIAIEKTGVNLLQLIPATERGLFKQKFDKALSGETSEMTYQSLETYYVVKYIPIRNEQREVTAVVQFSTDITNLMNAQLETKAMLQESQAQAEELRAQEEELRATMETEAQRNKDLERANSQAEAQKQMMLKIIEKLKEKEKESQAQTEELRTQEEELRAQQEELRQNMEELEATLEAEAKRGKESERNNAQLEAQKLMMTKSLEKFRHREKELLSELELKEKTITNLTKTISDN